MAAQLYDVLRNRECPLCWNEFEEGKVISFHGPCWIHPMCGECRAEWRITQVEVLGVYPTCPPCEREYNLFDEINIKLEPWHERGAVDYPPQPEGHVGVQNLAGHQAPCCDKGYTIGDYVIVSSCGGHRVHFMHAWCFLANRMTVDGNSLHFGDPFDCFTCGARYAPTNALTCHQLKPHGEEVKSEHDDQENENDNEEEEEEEEDQENENDNEEEEEDQENDNEDDDDEEEEDQENENENENDNEEEEEDQENENENDNEAEEEEEEEFYENEESGSEHEDQESDNEEEFYEEEDDDEESDEINHEEEEGSSDGSE